MLLSMAEVETVRSCLAVLDGCDSRPGRPLNSVQRQALETLEVLRRLESQRERMLRDAGLWSESSQEEASCPASLQ